MRRHRCSYEWVERAESGWNVLVACEPGGRSTYSERRKDDMLLMGLFAGRQAPGYLRDNRPEFTAEGLRSWLEGQGRPRLVRLLTVGGRGP